ncbi:O-antigen ligase family protein [Aeromicrobium sp.]|uniref:O-antigen ligase family protein n=1 Tax=Aeromicrobium sp. TaxID=1871063 RepID=UPI0030BDC74A
MTAAAMVTMLVAVGIEGSAIAVLTIGFVFAPLNDVRPIPALTFVTASDVCLLVATLLLAPGLLMKKVQPQVLFLAAAGCLVAVGLISSVANPEPFVNLNIMLRLVVGALLLPVLFMLWRPPRAVLVTFAIAYVAGNVVNVVQSVAFGATSFENRYIGLTTHPNVLGLCALLGLALVPFIYQELPKAYAWIVVGAGGTCAYGIWISGSRAALLVAVAVAVLYPVLSKSIETAVLLFGVSILPAYVVGRILTSGEVQNNILGRLVGGGSASASDQVREQVAQKALDKFLANPIVGGGFGEVLEAHNVYLQIAAACGLVGAVFYVILLVAVVRQPFMLGSSNLLLALPCMSYIMIGLMTPLIWDRYIWCVLALPFLVPLLDKSAVDDPLSLEPALSKESS